MKNALVIRTYGDPETCRAIVNGISCPTELQIVKAECARLKAQRDIHAVGAAKRHQAACEELAIKYYPEEHGRLYWGVMALWAMLWAGVYAIIDLLDGIDWNGQGY